METQSEICERKYGIGRQILKDESGGIYPACVDKITGKVIWDIYPGCHNVNGECPIHKKLREEKEAKNEKTILSCVPVDSRA